uniref:dihydropyrimidinase n=1 Tax=Chrysotila carterae TaxID=13221 RepID=A0A6S9T408_CHRCT
MTYDALKLSDTQMLDVLLLCRQHGAMVMVHAESHELVAWITAKLLDVELGGKFHAPHFHAMARPAVAEREAAHRAISFAEYVDTPLLIVHVSSGDTAAEIGRAKQRDIPIYGETCPQYLYLTDKCLCSAEGAKFLCSPPLRTEKEQAALWQALNEGVLQVVSSDHSAYNYGSAKGGASKTMGGTDAPFTKVPMGLPGLECRLPLLYSAALLGKISLTRMVEVVSTNPAKLYGLYPRKGALAVGADADIVVCDPNISSTIGSRSLHDELDYTPYEGVRVQGAVMFTFLRGDVVFRRDLRTGAEEITAARGGGQWCAAHTPHLLGHTNGARAWPCEGSVVLQRAAAFDAAMRGGVQQHPAAQRASEADATVEGETQPGAHTQAKEAIYDPAREGETACVPCDASDAEVWQLREKADL